MTNTSQANAKFLRDCGCGHSLFDQMQQTQTAIFQFSLSSFGSQNESPGLAQVQKNQFLFTLFQAQIPVRRKKTHSNSIQLAGTAFPPEPTCTLKQVVIPNLSHYFTNRSHANALRVAIAIPKFLTASN